MNWENMLKVLGGLTGNPATAAVFQLVGLAVHAVGVDTTKVNEVADKIQKIANDLVDAVQGQTTGKPVLPDIRMDEPRHEAAMALATEGTPVPAGVPMAASPVVPAA